MVNGVKPSQRRGNLDDVTERRPHEHSRRFTTVQSARAAPPLAPACTSESRAEAPGLRPFQAETRRRRATPVCLGGGGDRAATAGATSRLKTLGTMYSALELVRLHDRRDRVGGGELHLLVDRRGADVERAAEDARGRRGRC